MVRYSNSSYQKASGTRVAFAGLSADLVAEGFPEIQINSGDREPADQEREFLKKFVPSTGPKDVGPYNDRRYWAGHGWYKRVVGGGTVAVPLTSNHEKRRAADLAYPYNSNTAAHRRAQVLAKRHNITCEGLGFSEWWHWTYWGPLGSIGDTGSGAGGAEEALIVNESDVKWMNGLGQELKDHIDAAVKQARDDVNTVHLAVLASREGVQSAVAAIRADLNYVHVLSPYSLKAILEASKNGTVQLTDAQAAAIGGQLSAAAVAGIDAALKDDFDGVKARLAQLPAETIAALKSAL